MGSLSINWGIKLNNEKLFYTLQTGKNLQNDNSEDWQEPSYLQGGTVSWYNPLEKPLTISS